MKLSVRRKAKLRRKAKYWAERQELEDWTEIYGLLIADAINRKRKA